MRKDVTKWVIKNISYYCIWQALLSETAIYIKMDDISNSNLKLKPNYPTSASILCWWPHWEKSLQ